MQEMLRTFKGVGSGPINADPEGEKFIDLDHMVQLFRRQVRIVLLFAGIAGWLLFRPLGQIFGPLPSAMSFA